MEFSYSNILVQLRANMHAGTTGIGMVGDGALWHELS